MAIVPRSVTISPPSYTITTTGTGAAETYTFVFDPLRYTSPQSVSNFLNCLKLGQLGSVPINETDQIWSDSNVLRLGKLIMVRNDKLVRELSRMLKYALQRGNATIVDPSDQYPVVSTNNGVIGIAVAENIVYSIPISALSTVTWSERSTHLRNLESGDLGTLVLDFADVRIKFVVGNDTDIIISKGTQSHCLRRSRARAYRMLLQLYNIRG